MQHVLTGVRSLPWLGRGTGRKQGLLLGAAALLIFIGAVLDLIPFLEALVLMSLVLPFIAAGDATGSIALSRRNLIVAIAGLLLFALLNWQLFDLTRLPGLLPAGLATTLLVLPLAMERRAVPAEATGRSIALTQRDLMFAISGLIVFLFSYSLGVLFLSLTALILIPPVVMVGLRVFQARRGMLGVAFPRHPLRQDLRPYLLQCLNQWLFWGLLGAAILPGTFAGYRISMSSAGYRGLIVALWVAVVVMMVVALFPAGRVRLATNAAMAVGTLFLGWQLVQIYQTPSDAVVLDLPFQQEMYAVHAGHSSLINGHYTHRVERDALDIIRVVDGRSAVGDTSALSSYFAYGQPLAAPADGVITQVIDSFIDQPIGQTDGDNPTGNVVVIDIGGRRYVVMAHLLPGSVLVAPGEQVRRGQQIALIGNSGNTSEPHLHVQVQNRPTFDIKPAAGFRTYPILFRDTLVIRDGDDRIVDAADLRRGDHFRPID